MVISPGTALGPYEIETQLGAGGMGEVYRARDTRLGRTVAIKILPTHLSGDPIRKQRFEREAKIISSLNHPHICVLYDIGHCDGAEYLVMECVEGETLANRLKKGPLPLVQVLKYGTEIADALDKAHRSGVVHRDLKPGNIMLTATGAKLLDFGLAKPFHTSSGMTLTSAITQSTPVTADGAIVGTFQYMSPEQVEGREVDGRSDIFSLGAVLYEMLTGKQAFSGKSHLSVASAILESQPQSPSALKPLTPKALEHAIRRCLEKDREDRWQTPRDLGQELKWVAASGEQEAGVSAASSRRSRRKLVWLVLGVLAAATLAAAVWWRIDKPASQTMYYFAPLPFPARDMAISPNGHTVAIVAYQESVRKNVLWIYDLGSLGARSMTDTTGATYPFWSPDGAFVGFFADGRLKKLEIANGQVHVICDAASGRGGTWNRNNVIVFTPMAAGGLYRVPATGGTPTPIDRPDASRGEETHRWPAFLPDGQHYLYLAANFSGRKGVDAIFAGSLDSNEKRFIVEATANAAYVQPGYLLFCQGRTLFAQRFDAKSLVMRGEPTAILAEIQTVPQVSRAVFVATNQDVVLAQTGSGLPLSQPIWFDRKGNETGDVGKPDIYSNVSLALNGKWLAVDKTDMGSQNTDIWVYEAPHDGVKRLTFDPAIDIAPVWSPDSRRIVFSSSRQMSFDMYMKSADGTDEDKLVVHDQFDKVPHDWSRDGKYILYTQGTDLRILTVSDFKTADFLKGAPVIRNAQFSPDGKWVAYASNESGKWEIYVSSFPESRGKWQVSNGGGEQPRWRGDGRELFYLSSDSKVMSASVIPGANFNFGTPAALFQATPRQPITNKDQFVYNVSQDGQRFLINTQVKSADRNPISVILHWTAKLQE